MAFDAVLVLSFGGPDQPGDVIPFLENVLRGRNVPPERLLEVAAHYYHFGGRSPINDQNRALIRAIEAEMASRGPQLPIYWGNRNWHPLLADTLRQMRQDGVREALCLVTSAFTSYSGCRQYREDIERARAEVGPDSPVIEKLRAFHNQPGFIEAMAERCREALRELSGAPSAFVFTAHSIPMAMARSSRYEEQLREACARVASAVGRPDWRLVYQSRSGPLPQPWLEPDIGAYLREIHDGGEGPREVVVVPIGFISDHMEVVYDLDYEAKNLAKELGMNLIRAGTAGVHPNFVKMLRDLIAARVSGADPGDFCPPDCCVAQVSGLPRK
ncbi:MAG: ferrochelatase [Bryobacteraceae bacterium]